MASISDVTGFMDWMNRNWQQSFAPIQDYSSFLLQLAVQKRQREMQLQDEARRTAERRAEAETERAFTRERDTARELATTTRDLYLNRQQEQAELDRRAFEERMVDVRAAADRKTQEDRLALLTKAEREEKRRSKIEEARGRGIGPEELADNASYGDAVEAVSRSYGKELVQSAKVSQSVWADYQRAKGESIASLTRNAIRQAVAAEGITDKELRNAKMTQDDLNAVINNPELFEQMRADASRAKNKPKAELLMRLEGRFSQIVQADMEKLERYHPELGEMSNRYRSARENYLNLQKRAGYDEASGIEASNELMRSVFGGQQQQQKTQGAPPPPPLPPPPHYWPEGMPSSPASVASPGQWQGVVPLVQQGTGGMSPAAMVARPGEAALRTLSAAAAPGIQEIGQTITSDPGVQGLGRIVASPFRATSYALYGGEPPVWPTPEDLAVNLSVRSPSAAMRAILDRITQARMRTATGDQAAAQNALAPTAFPVLPPVFTGAP